MATDWHLLENNAADDLNGAVAGGDGTIELTSAAEFPVTGDFLVTVWDANTFFHPGDDDGSGSGDGMEVMLVTGVAGAVLTVTRAQAGTAAVAHGDGDAVELKLMVEHLEQITGAVTTLEGHINQGVKTTDTPTFAGLLATDEIKFTQPDGNESIDSANDGYLDFSATTGHRFNNDVSLIEDTADTASPKLYFEGGNTRTGTLQQLEDAASFSAFVMDTNGSIELRVDGTARLTVDTSGNVIASGELEVNGALNHDGSTAGFYATTPIAQALLATGAAATVDDVITALQNLGLVKQS